MAWARSSSRMNSWILVLAPAEVTMESQSRLGLWSARVNTSTRSPFCRMCRSGTMRPLTLAPTQWCPTSVWMA